MKISPATHLKIFDIDGVTVATHGGYDYPTTEALFADYPGAYGVTITNRLGNWRIARNPRPLPVVFDPKRHRFVDIPLPQPEGGRGQ